jgi:hypothetical protein
MRVDINDLQRPFNLALAARRVCARQMYLEAGSWLKLRRRSTWSRSGSDIAAVFEQTE